jgi:hypothetical protein
LLFSLLPNNAVSNFLFFTLLLFLVVTVLVESLLDSESPSLLLLSLEDDLSAGGLPVFTSVLPVLPELPPSLSLVSPNKDNKGEIIYEPIDFVFSHIQLDVSTIVSGFFLK